MQRGPLPSSRQALLLAPLLYFVPETSIARRRGGGGSRSVQYSHKGAAIAVLMIGAIALFGWLDNHRSRPAPRTNRNGRLARRTQNIDAVTCATRGNERAACDRLDWG